MGFRRLLFTSALVLLAAAKTGPERRQVGPQPDGSIVASDNQLLTPAGMIVNLGSPVRAKAVAINPHGHTAAVLLMHAAEPVIVFDTATGQLIQRFTPTASATGAITGITYTPDGTRLLFSQDGNFVSVAGVSPRNGTITQSFSVALPSPPPNPNLFNKISANAAGIAATADGATALVALNASNTLGVIDLATHALTRQIAVGNAPNHVVIAGNFAYVSNEGGRPATARDFTNLSDGTPIVVDRREAFATTGTVSVIDLRSFRRIADIEVGLHPAGMAIAGNLLYVANTYSDTVSVIDTATNTLKRTIDLGLPIAGGAFGAGPNDIAVQGNVAYVTLGQANAVAVVDLRGDAVAGYIPTAYFPAAIRIDAAGTQLVVANDKGLGAQGSKGKAHGVSGFKTRQDTGVISIIPITAAPQLAAMSRLVIANNNWQSPAATPGHIDPHAAPVAIPREIGEPSLIKHVFLIIKENRTYDQMLGDLKQGNGDPSLAVFAADAPNQHALVKRFPLLDNIYAPSRQSADGHPWIVESGSFYSNEIQSPDWIRSYPGGQSNDALAYTPRGFLWSQAERRGLVVKMYGEWSNGHAVDPKPGGGRYSWADFYNTHLYTISHGAQGANIVPQDAVHEGTAVASAAAILDPHYPAFDLGIPDQYRADEYIPQLQAQDVANQVPDFTILWLPNDHTDAEPSARPLPASYQADNDLALGRIVDAISHSKAWPGSAIFVEEDDSQDGVDHVDGHRQPVYVISPYTVKPQAPGVGRVIGTTYTQENINRTIENILGLQPLTQFDRTVPPMFDCFQDTPDTTPFTYVPAATPLNIGPGNTPIAGTGPLRAADRISPIEHAWIAASNAVMKTMDGKADAVDERFLNHAIWYSATHWRRPYPGEKQVQYPGAFTASAARRDSD
jgi:YVTN family beta-propeller protein